MDTLWAYLNGHWVPKSELTIGVDDVGFLLGATVTERLRTFGGKVFRRNEHLDRLRHSLEIIGLDPPGIAGQVAAAIPEFLERNGSQIPPDDDWSVVAFATPGRAGGQPTVCVYGFPLQFQLWASHYETGVPIVISDVQQIPPACMPPELKCRSRMHYYLADQRAAAARPGARAVLLDWEGNVAEATTANIIVYREGEGLVTPPREHILFGVSLGVVQELAARINVPFVTRPLQVDELCSADEAMLASTSVCLLPIVECDGEPIGERHVGKMYGRILAAWDDLVGIDIAEQARRCAPRRI